MSMDLSQTLNIWVWAIVALVIVVVILRFFLHTVVHVIQFAFRFFWHGCSIAILLLVIYFILHILNII